MKKTVFIFALVLASLVLSGCPQPPTDGNNGGSGETASGDIEVHYSTGAMHREWGAYDFEAGSGGKATFVKSAGDSEKSYEFDVSAAELGKIYETAESKGFFTLNDSYNDPSIMDGGWSDITISGNGKSKTVRVTNYSLPEFEGVETGIVKLIMSKLGDGAFSLDDME